MSTPSLAETTRTRSSRRHYLLATMSIMLLCLASTTHTPLHAAPPSPGSVVAPVDKPVIQPERATSSPVTREAEKPESIKSSSGKTLQVQSFEFEGNTIFTDEELQSLTESYLNTDLDINEVYQVADYVERYYRSSGYLLTSVYIPAQKISSGTVTLEVIEGKLGEISLEGNLDSYSEGFIRDQVDSIRSGEIIDDATLETEALLLADLPGLDVRAVIRPGTDYGSSDILFVTEEDRYSSLVSVNNYGRRSIGEYRVEGGFLMANPVFEGDVLNLSAILAQDAAMLYARLDYEAPINRSGTRLGFGASLFDYDVDVLEIGFTDPTQTLGGSGTNLQLTLNHPFIRSHRDNLFFDMVARQSNTEEDGSLAIRPENTINLLDIGLTYSHLYRNAASTTLRGVVTTNFKSRENLLDTTSQKAKLTFSLSHFHPFASSWFAQFAATLVHSSDPLVDVERFRIGGQGSVRAYPSAELAGDKGNVLSLDIGKRFSVSGDVLMTAKVFADSGTVDRIQPIGVPASESLSGIGASLSTVLASSHTIDLEIVSPTSDKVSSDGDDTRFWLNYRGLF